MNKILSLLLVVCLSGQALAAKMEVLDSIAAVVNDDVIMQSELQERVDEVSENLARKEQRMPPEDIIRSQVLDRLIEERLQLGLAHRMGIRVDDTSLNEAIAGIARQNNLTLDEFASKVRADGLDWAGFREQIRTDMIMNQVRQRQVGPRIRVTDGEIDRFLESETGKQLFASAFHLGHILVQLPDGASPEQIDAAEKEANSIVAQLRKGAEFREMAVAHSDDSYALEGGDLGWRPAAQWPSLFSDKAINMQDGDIAGPLRSANGFHIIKLIEKRGDEQKMVEQYQARHILIKPSTIRSPEEARTLARKLAQRVKSGEDFAQLAREYSDDPGSARNGGELGWVSEGEMVPEFEKQMLATQAGELSPVFETQYGWHFLRVDNTRTADMSDEFRRLKARQALQQRRYSEEMQSWLREIRAEAYVDLRI